MIDWDRVIELRDEVGAEDFEEIVELFLEEVEDAIRSLTPQLSVAQMEECLHFLKGSALNLGFEVFSSLCAEGERIAAAGSTESIDINAIGSAFRASREGFLSNWKQKACA